MDSPVLEYEKNHGPQLTLIQTPKTIGDQDVKTHEKWRVIKQWYEQVENDQKYDNWVNRAVHSIINAIVYQERKAFCLGLHATRELVKKDKNWKKTRKNIGMKNENYGKLIARLTNELKIIERIYDGSGEQKLSAYKVVHPSILDMIQGKTLEEQIEESIFFAQNNKDEPKGETVLNPLLLPMDKTNDFNNLEKGETKGETGLDDMSVNQEKPNDNNILPKGETKGEIEVRNKKKEVRNKYSFKVLFKKQNYETNVLPSFDEVKELALMAVENCQEFEVTDGEFEVMESHKKNLEKIFKEHLIKPSSNQLKLIKDLVDAFARSAEDYYYSVYNTNDDLVQPKDIASVDSEEVFQLNTLTILRNAFQDSPEEKLNKIQYKINSVNNDVLKQELINEYNYYKEKFYGKQSN